MVIISSRVYAQKAGRDTEEDILKSKIQKVIRNYRTFVSPFPVHWYALPSIGSRDH